MGKHRAEKVERVRRPLRKAVTSALACVAMGLGFAVAQNESESKPEIGVAVYSDCADTGINIGEHLQAASRRGSNKITVESLVRQEQSDLCRAAGNVASDLLLNYAGHGNASTEEGRQITVSVADQNKDGQQELTVKDSRMYGGAVLSLTAEATKIDGNKWKLGELQKVSFRYDANFAAVEYADGEWSAFTFAGNDKAWPSVGYGVVTNFASAQDKLVNTTELIRTMHEVNEGTYSPQPYL